MNTIIKADKGYFLLKKLFDGIKDGGRLIGLIKIPIIGWSVNFNEWNYIINPVTYASMQKENNFDDTYVVLDPNLNIYESHSELDSINNNINKYCEKIYSIYYNNFKSPIELIYEGNCILFKEIHDKKEYSKLLVKKRKETIKEFDELIFNIKNDIDNNV